MDRENLGQDETGIFSAELIRGEILGAIGRTGKTYPSLSFA